MSDDGLDWLRDEVKRNRLSGNDIEIPEGPSVPIALKEFERQFADGEGT